VYEHPTLMVHARYHYGAPLEAHDPRWLQKVQEARDRAAERPAFKARPVPRCLRRPEGQPPPRHAEEEESVDHPQRTQPRRKANTKRPMMFSYTVDSR
jgi:hypothetical protein